MKFLQQYTSRKCQKLVGNWTLQHNNFNLHFVISIQQYLNKCPIKITPHPLYSLGLEPSDLWLFSTVKEKLHGKKFNRDSEVISAVQVLWSIFHKKASLFVLKCWLNNGTDRYYLRENTLKRNVLFFAVNILLYFFLFYCQFLWNALCLGCNIELWYSIFKKYYLRMLSKNIFITTIDFY